MSHLTQIMPFGILTPPLEEASERRVIRVPHPEIISIIIHFPPGPQFLVDVRVVLRSKGSKGKVLLAPTEEDAYFSLDDTLLPLTGLSIPAAEGDTVEVEWRNFDGAFPHRVPVEVIVNDIHADLTKPENR